MLRFIFSCPHLALYRAIMLYVHLQYLLYGRHIVGLLLRRSENRPVLEKLLKPSKTFAEQFKTKQWA